MKNLAITIVIALGTVLVLMSSSRAEMATLEEALTVANNWITLIIHKKGSWGDSTTANVEEIREFRRGERPLGYFCRVEPAGFIVVSLHKELAPIKACSETSCLDPKSDKGLSDIIKLGMERVLKAIEEQLGPIGSVRTQDLKNILEINYRAAWAELSRDVGTFQAGLESDAIAMNYQEGNVLLNSSWHQEAPYNTLCPTGDTGCADCCPTEPWVCAPTAPTLVGCVATAGAQIMKHWNWPPYADSNHAYNWDGDGSCPVGPGTGGQRLNVVLSDTYDWRRIANRYTWDALNNRWEDENGNPMTQAHIDAVTELCYEVGVAVEMDYGVCASGVATEDMEGVYENFYRYSKTCVKQNRNSYTAVNWFDRMKAQFNANRPVHYRVERHSIVGDGWREIGTVPTRQYHMNYGWDRRCDDPNGCNTWYTLDALHLGGIDEEYMLEGIYPVVSLGNSLSGTYGRDASFPYRYFDQDATGNSASFVAGQNLQFLPRIKATCTSTTGGSIRFVGTSPLSSRLYSIRGTQVAAARIYNGDIKLYQNGSIKFH